MTLSKFQGVVSDQNGSKKSTFFSSVVFTVCLILVSLLLPSDCFCPLVILLLNCEPPTGSSQGTLNQSHLKHTPARSSSETLINGGLLYFRLLSPFFHSFPVLTESSYYLYFHSQASG